jgi:hypothetical protein
MCFSLTYVRPPQTHPSRSRDPRAAARPDCANFQAPRPLRGHATRFSGRDRISQERRRVPLVFRGSLALALDTVQTSNYPTVLDSARSHNAQHMHNDPSHLCAFSSPHTANSLAAQRSALSARRSVQ